MKHARILVGSACLGLVLAVGGCTVVEPYAYREEEFDRLREGFGQDPEDLEEVMICYNTKNATRESVIAMAQETCGKYGKVARYSHSTFLTCPVLEPAGATFDCVATGWVPGRSGAGGSRVDPYAFPGESYMGPAWMTPGR